MEEFALQLVRVVSVAIGVAFLVENSLSFFFSWRHFQARFSGKGVKWIITAVFCLVLCFVYPLDLLSMLLGREIEVIGQIITAGFLGGGSRKIALRFGEIRGQLQESRNVTIISPGSGE